MIGLFLTTDLLFSSKVTGAAGMQGLKVEVVMSAAKLMERLATDDVRLILLDLTAPQLNPTTLIPELKKSAPQAHLVAFGPHVQEQALLAAHQAGCNDVLTRGQFNMECHALLKRHLSAEPTS